MLNPFKEVQWRPNLAERRKFGVSLMIGFPILALLLWTAGWAFSEEPPTDLMGRVGVIGFGAGLLFVLVPWIATPFYQVWYGFACVMGIVVGNVALSLIYFVLFGGVGWLMRRLRPNFFRKRFDPNASTYWEDTPAVLEPRRYYKQY